MQGEEGAGIPDNGKNDITERGKVVKPSKQLAPGVGGTMTLKKKTTVSKWECSHDSKLRTKKFHATQKQLIEVICLKG